jgi:hypothetical protein
MAAENLTGNLPNKSFGEYQRPLPRDFELANNGDMSWKNEASTLSWDKLPVLPTGIFTSFDSSVVAVDQAIYIGNGDTSSIQAAWGDISQFDWVRYSADASVWYPITPTKGQLCYDTSATTWYTYDTSSTGWLEMQTVISSGNSYTTKTIDIGDWNMDTSSTVPVAHTLSATEWKTIRTIDVIIRNDADTEYRPIDVLNAAATGVSGGGVISLDSTNIRLGRYTGGLFDSTDFDSTSYNRGWITFDYIKD